MSKNLSPKRLLFCLLLFVSLGYMFFYSLTEKGDVQSIMTYLLGMVQIGLGLFVLFQGRKKEVNVTFFGFSLALAVWNMIAAVVTQPHRIPSLIFWDKFIFVPATLLFALLLHFSLSFPRKADYYKRGLSYLVFVLPLFLILISPTDLIIKGMELSNGVLAPSFGPLYPLFAVYSIIYVMASLIVLVTKYYIYEGNEKRQLFYFFTGISCLGISLIFANLLLSWVGIAKLAVFGQVFSLFPLGFTAYAIAKPRLVDISVVISRTAAEMIVALFHSVIYLALVWFYRSFSSTQIDLPFILLSICYGVIVGESHYTLRLFAQTTSDKLFIHGRYDYYRALSDASARVGEELSLDAILKILYKTFIDVVEISNPRVYLPEYFSDTEKSSTRYLNYSRDKYLPQPEEKALANDSPLVTKLITRREPLSEVKELSATLVVPCLLEERLIALFVLGKKVSEDSYTDEDMKLLKVLANQAAVALDHTRSYEKIKADLELAERELIRAQRLASLGTLTAGVTHEIRNPLAVIRSETERLMTKPRDEEYVRQYGNLVIKHADRIANIIARMLDFAKDKTKTVETVNLNEVIQSTLQMFPISRITLKQELAEVPPVKGDMEELQEVFVNLIQNAIEAMPEGGTLTLRSYREEGKVVAEVSDTGKGIPAEIQKRIFDPFFSTRHEGVGLGLSIVYRIIHEHDADIKIASEMGKGTTFKLIF